MVKKKPFIIATSCFLIFLSIICLHRFILCFAIENILSHKSTAFSSSKMSYKRLGYHKNSLFLEGVSLVDRKTKQEQIHIDKVECVVSSAFMSGLTYKLIRPSVSLGSFNSPLSTKQWHVYEWFSSPFFSKKWTIEEGKIALTSKQDLTKAYLFFTPGDGANNIGSCTIALNDSDAEHLRVSVYKEEDHIDFQLHFEKVPLGLFHDIFPSVSSHLKGNINGDTNVRITREDKILCAESDLEIVDIEISESSFLLKSHIPSVEVHAYLNIEEPISLFDKEGILQSLIAGCGIKNGKTCFIHQSTGKLWEIEDLHGNLSLNMGESQQLNICGTLRKEEVSHPFTISGEGSINFEDAFYIDLEIAGVSNMAPVMIHIESNKKREYEISSQISQLNIRQLEILKELLEIKYPDLGTVKIYNGDLSTDIQLVVEQGRIKVATFDKLECHDLIAKIENRDLQFSCKEAKGKLKLFFPKTRYAQAPIWDVTFHDLTLNQKNNIYKTSGFISSKDNRIHPSWIRASAEGIAIECSIHGPFSNLEVAGSVNFEEKHLGSFFQEEILKVKEHIQPLSKADFSFKMRGDKGKSNILGIVHLGYGDLIDKIRFGLSFADKESWIPKWKHFDKGWFQSDKLSEHTYLWFLKYFHQKWYALGDMKVTGEITKEKITFDLETEQAVYDSEDVFVDLSKKDVTYTGNFVFDCLARSWLIKLPISSAKCIDKKFHLPFDDVAADVTIEGMKLSVTHISAWSEKVFFGGHLDVDFHNPEWIDLRIYPTMIKGDFPDFIRFLNYLPEFANFHPSVTGKIEGVIDNHIFTQYNQEKSEKQIKIGLHLSEIKYEVNEACALEKTSCDLHWDSQQQSLDIKDLQGDIVFQKEMGQKSYHLNAQRLTSKNILQGIWDFDVRVEASTFDVLRVVGSTKQVDRTYHIFLRPDQTHFFGAKPCITNFAISSDAGLESLELKAKISAQDLISQMQLAYASGLIQMPSVFMDELSSGKASGEIEVKLDYAMSKMCCLEVISDELKWGENSFDHLQLKMHKMGDRIYLENLKFSSFAMQLEVDQAKEKQWNINRGEISWNHSKMHIGRGTYKKGLLDIDLEKIDVILDELSEHLAVDERWEKILTGEVTAVSHLNINIENGLPELKAFAEINLQGRKLSEAQLNLSSKQPLVVTYSYKEGIKCEKIHFVFEKEGLEEGWANLDINLVRVAALEKSIHCRGIKLVLPPEMLLYCGQKKLLMPVQAEGQSLVIGEKSFTWDNQIDSEIDMTYESGNMHIQGILKEGYYWIGKKSLYLQKIHFVFQQGQLNVLFGCDDQDITVDVLAQVQFREEIEAKVILKEGHVEGYDDRQGLEILCKYGQEDGFYLQSIEGSIYGIEFALRRNPRAYMPYVMILTGQTKIDTSGLIKAFPKLFDQTFRDLGMGNGYELSGDWVLSKKDFASSYFKGFLKGRDFEFLGFYFKTLLSEVELTTKSITVQDFSLSDMSGSLKMKEIKIEKNQQDLSWVMHIPQIHVQDFRPSFLKKNDGSDERVKPFVIKDLHFFDITGTLGKKESFSGKGYLDFINTFKREYNILDIPIEIIGRIGLDLGLFVPVIGKLEFEMNEGKIYLNELKHTFSDGKRSKFYLSKRQDSYIGLDGSLCIDIKMKQYVLLKITEPFTLSVRGTLLKPRYSLR